MMSLARCGVPSSLVGGASTDYTEKKARIGEKHCGRSKDSASAGGGTSPDLDSLWKEFFRDPSLWRDNRNSSIRVAISTQTSPSIPDFQHKLTKESLWIDCWNTPCWVQEELTKRALQTSKGFKEDEEEENNRKDEEVEGEGEGAKVLLISDRSHSTPSEEVTSSPHTLVALLKECSKQKDLRKGTKVHADARRLGLLENDAFVGSALVRMYAKCSSLAKAQEVFDELPVRDSALWLALISGYVQHGRGQKALSCFEQMQLEGITPNAIIFTSILKACGSVGASDKGIEIHDEIIRRGLLESDIYIGTALVDMYAKCGLLAEAQEVFDKLQVRDVVLWSALIAGYAQHGDGKEALHYFEQMSLEAHSPNAVTFVSILKACGSIKFVEKGLEIHSRIVREGLLDNDSVLGTALVDMYAKCGKLAEAQEEFNKIEIQDVVAWNALITGYAQLGHGEEALYCFQQMQDAGFSPNTVTLVCILKACFTIGAADKGHKIHAGIVKEGLLAIDISIGTALVDMYAKCGLLVKARELFDVLPVQDVVLWNTLIAGFELEDCGEDALACFDEMLMGGFSPDAHTFACVLKACGSTGALERGQEIHVEIARRELLKNDIVLNTALVDMYAKCGLLANAQEIFETFPVRDAASWNSLITGYALLGKPESVFLSFNKMMKDRVQPDVVTFTSLLNACGHTGLLDKGQVYFENLDKMFGIIPNLEHYTCIVDLFGRAGDLAKAVAVVKSMPFSADLTLWHTVLGACQRWGNMKVGRLAFEQAVDLDEKSASAYVCLSNIFLDAAMQTHVNKGEDMQETIKHGSSRGIICGVMQA